MSSVGIIGLGPIGKNLSLNIQENRDIHVFNRTHPKMYELVNETTNVHGHATVLDMVDSMKRPRTVMTALPHGKATDSSVNDLVTILSPGDTIIDLANEHFKVSRNRSARCERRNVNYLGVGISGGANGARNGPALMVGGKWDVFSEHHDFFSSFAKNVAYMGDDPGLGHFTKMVHNGVEYGMLQGIADIFAYCGQDCEVMEIVMAEASGTDINGFLVNSARDITRLYDISKIADVADMNNTGSWCSTFGLNHGIPTPIINSALNARITSKRSRSFNTINSKDLVRDVSTAVNALRFVFASSIIEGYDLMSETGVSKNCIRKAWSSGTIIDCPMIEKQCFKILDDTSMDARVFTIQCASSRIPCPAVQAALTQYDFVHQKRTSMNFLMAQRNYFGQHTLIEI